MENKEDRGETILLIVYFLTCFLSPILLVIGIILEIQGIQFPEWYYVLKVAFAWMSIPVFLYIAFYVYTTCQDFINKFIKKEGKENV